MASCCGPLTFISMFLLFLIAASLALTGGEDARAGDAMALAPSMHSVRWGRSGGRPGHERIAVDRRRPSGRRRNGRRGNRGRGSRRRRPMPRGRRRSLIGHLAVASATFSLNMYDALKQDLPELLFSPYSIHSALTMTYLGAARRTARQMNKALGLRRLRRNKAHLAYASLTNSLNEEGNVTLNVANAVYVRPNLPIEQAFRDGLENMYKARFDLLDLEADGGPEAPINAWVANKTEDKIQNLLSPGLIDRSTALVLINAIYFKGSGRPLSMKAAQQNNRFIGMMAQPATCT